MEKVVVKVDSQSQTFSAGINCPYCTVVSRALMTSKVLSNGLRGAPTWNISNFQSHIKNHFSESRDKTQRLPVVNKNNSTLKNFLEKKSKPLKGPEPVVINQTNNTTATVSTTSNNVENQVESLLQRTIEAEITSENLVKKVSAYKAKMKQVVDGSSCQGVKVSEEKSDGESSDEESSDDSCVLDEESNEIHKNFTAPGESNAGALKMPIAPVSDKIN